MVIQKATPDDANLIARLNRAVHDIHLSAHPEFFQDPLLEEVTVSLREYMSREHTHTLVLFTDSGEPVGYIIVYLRESTGNAFTYPRKLLYIDQIAVLPEYRHRGYGMQLIDAVKDHAKNLGIKKIALDVWTFNQRAQAFFQSQGFEPYNVRMWMDI